MKILYLLPQPKGPERIGAYSFLDEEIKAIAAAGIEAYVLSTAAPEDSDCGGVHLLSVQARSSMAVRVRAAGFLARTAGRASGRHLGQPFVWYRSARMEHLGQRMVEEKGIDLVHSHFAWPQGFGGSLGAAARHPLIASLRGTDILLDRSIGYGRRAQPGFDRALRGLLKRADRTLYFSQYMREQAVALGAPPERATVIPKGVDLRHFDVAEDRNLLKSELGLPARPMILTVGGLIPRKGIHHLLQALGGLRERHDFTLVICGDGPEELRLKELATSIGLADRTIFTGRVDRATIPRYFAACDIFALASTVEAAGNVLFEAMASGRPIVCTNAGGPQEYVRDGETGFVVPVGNVTALTARLEDLLVDAVLRETLGREGRRRTLEEFSYQRMVKDLIQVYEEVLRTSPQERLAG